ncbi:wd-repeat family protein [Moumouvirus maliensis]|nr:wd-repeat family protein [Moumouvirus maliensis]
MHQMNFKILYRTKSNSVKIWNPNDLHFVSRPKIFHQNVKNVSISSTNLIALSSINNNIYLYDTNTGLSKYFIYGEEKIKHIYFSPSSKYLVCHYNNDTLFGTNVKIYDYQNNKLVFNSENILPKLSFSHDEKQIIYGYFNVDKINLKTYHFEEKKYDNIYEIDNLTYYYNFNIKWSYCGNYLVANVDNKLYLWNNKFDILNEILFQSEENYCGTINVVSFSPDNKQVIIGFFSGLIKILDVESGDVIILQDIQDGNKLESINCIEFSKCEKYIIIGKSNGVIDIWDYKNEIICKSLNDLDSNFKDEMDLYNDYMMSTGNSLEIIQLSIL